MPLCSKCMTRVTFLLLLMAWAVCPLPGHREDGKLGNRPVARHEAALGQPNFCPGGSMSRCLRCHAIGLSGNHGNHFRSGSAPWEFMEPMVSNGAIGRIT